MNVIHTVNEIVSNALDMNQATLSGAIDIIAVWNETTNSIACTPFHVRFGKLQLLRSKEKKVQVYINGSLANELDMKLGAAGEAFFVRKMDNDISRELVTSPCGSPNTTWSSDPCENTDRPEWHDAYRIEQNGSADEGASWKWNWGNLPIVRRASVEGNATLGAKVKSMYFDAIDTEANGFGFHMDLEEMEDKKKAPMLSMCAGLIQGVEDGDAKSIFMDHIVSEDEFKRDPLTMLQNKELMCLMDDCICPVQVALASFVSSMVYGKEMLPEERKELCGQCTTGKRSSSWLGWFRPNMDQITLNDQIRLGDDEVLQDASDDRLRTHSSPAKIQMSKQESRDSFQWHSDALDTFGKSMVPNSEQLNAIWPLLKAGKNKIEFCVRSSFQGERRVEAHLYVLNANAKLVVSNIDGTISKPGGLTQLMSSPQSHQGVASLFANIDKNGYQIIYLTTRAIGQKDITKAYLQGVCEGSSTLPDGPVLLSPNRLVESNTRKKNVEESFDFKSAVLSTLDDLFPKGVHPFVAGFGNSDVDRMAYEKAGISPGKIYIMDENDTFSNARSSYKKSYMEMTQLVHSMFPYVEKSNIKHGISKVRSEEKFNESNFWRIPHASLHS